MSRSMSSPAYPRAPRKRTAPQILRDGPYNLDELEEEFYAPLFDLSGEECETLTFCFRPLSDGQKANDDEWTGHLTTKGFSSYLAVARGLDDLVWIPFPVSVINDSVNLLDGARLAISVDLA